MGANNISPSDLRFLLDRYDQLFEEEKEARQFLIDRADQVFASGRPIPAWCHLYELPAQQQFIRVGLDLGLQDELEYIGRSPNQIDAAKTILGRVNAELDAYEPTPEEKALLQENLGTLFAMATSASMSIRALMTFGLYMNDMIVMVRAGGRQGDSALVSAVKIDPTVLGCPSVIARMSKAVMLKEEKFLRKVQRALSGKLTKREQKNYQQMRIVLQVMHETGAARLNQDDLYSLFVDELKLIRGEVDTDEGNVANNLRQFAYQFLKLKGVSEKPANSLAG